MTSAFSPDSPAMLAGAATPLSRRSMMPNWLAVLTAAIALVLCDAGTVARAQTAHFDGAELPVASEGNGILAIAVDAAGDVIFTTQNPESELAQARRRVQYVPAALQLTGTRHFSDGRRDASAQKMNASSCNYGGPGSALYIRLANSSTIYMIGGFNAPAGLAIDSTGNLYVLDAYTGIIYKFLGANGSVQVESVYGVGVTLNGPTMVAPMQGNACTGGDLATDSLGNLYYTTFSGNTVEEIEAVNGVIPASPTTRSLGSGYDLPLGIAVDSSGDVYVASIYNNAVEEIVAVNGSIPASPTIRTLGSGFYYPAAVSVDSRGDVYVSDSGNNALKEILAVNGSIPSSPTIEILGSFSGSQAVTLDGSGDIFAGDSVNNGGNVIELMPNGANFGAVNIGTTSTAVPMNFTFTTAGTLGSIAVLTQGATGQDFANPGSGTCKANTAYTAGQTCTVNVTFAPKFSGTRNGAVVLLATNGNVIATGYLQGTGVGPQVNFLPGAQSTVLATGLSNPTGVAVDGSGNVYLVDTGNNRVLKETLSSGAYSQSTVSSDLSAPYGVAVDGSGAVYIADTGNNRVLKETPTASGYSESTIASGVGNPSGVAVDGSGNVYITNSKSGLIMKETLGLGGYTQSTIVSGLSSPAGVAVDGSGDVYIADTGNNRVLKETLSGGIYTQSILPSNSLLAPTGIAVDGTGNVYVVFQSDFLVFKDSLSAGGYTSSTLVSGLNSSIGPFAVAVDASGNLYIGDEGNNQVLKEDLADPPSLSFASTAVGATSADSPKTVTLGNNGNAALTLPIPATGNNPSIGADFSLNSSGQSDCPVLSSASTSEVTLAPGTTCELPVSFAPTVLGSLAESLVLTDNNLNAAGPNYTTQTISLSGAGAVTPAIAWSTPAPITYGTALSTAQLNATANVAGTFSYSPAAGTVLEVGAQTITVTFTPNDNTDYTTATATVTLTVNQATPTITWGAPAAVTYGTALSATQLDASSTTAGTFAYSPAAGTVLTAGPQTLTVTFTPTDTVDYTTSTATATLAVNQATPTITWSTPAAITYGTALSATQLNASSTTAGTFSYSPAAGAVLTAGTQTLTVTFTPTDTADYTTATATVTLTVNQATPAITWPTPAAITYGTALSAAQLDANSTVAGTFAYSPAVGAVLTAGSQTLTATFTPTDTADYTTATATVTLTVNQATPSLSWATPASITYGTALSATQLNASSTIAGTFAYSPALGTVLTAGTHTVTLTFTPTDTVDYTTATATVTVTVNQAAPALTWATPAPITYGTALGATQLDASSTIAGTFTYTPAAGTVLNGGSQTLTATFTPSDTVDYSTTTASVTLVVNKATPVITWATPAAITYGTALSATQLDASSTVAGAFTYSPAAGTVLNAGSQTLTVTFTPTNTTDYSTTTASVTLIVNKATPVITWATPAAITQGTALSATQLDATSTVAGTFIYSPAAGTVLSAGSQTLTTTFTPTNTTDYTTATDSVVLTVNPAPSFTLAASPTSLSIVQGANGKSTITLTAKNGFSGGATLTATGLPSGVTASFGTNPITGTSVLTLTASSTATVGAATVTITGTSGSLTASTTVALTVTAKPGFACHVVYSITSQWPAGFGTAITIDNTGTVAISNWTLTFAFANGQKVTQTWNGNESQSGANVTVTNMSYNGSIPAGGSYNGMGFNGSWNNITNAVPASFAVNGTVCK